LYSSTAQITVLYDAFGKTSTMRKDWGFSALIEYGGKRILFDTGNNADIFAHNVEAKGVDLKQLDFAVVSHRHGDHTSGLNHLLKVNPGVKIYAPQENFGVFGAALPGSFYKRNESLPSEMRYFDGKPPETLRFGSPWPEGNFTWVAKTTEIMPGFHLILLNGSTCHAERPRMVFPVILPPGRARLAEVAGKRLQLLKEVIPSLSCVAFLWNPDNASHPAQVAELQVAVQTLGIKLLPVAVRSSDEFDRRVVDDANTRDFSRLLCPRRERPRGRCTAEQGEELATFHRPMPPVLSAERIAHLGTAGACCAAGFHPGFYIRTVMGARKSV
jgi:hypothetical protein